MPMDMETYVEQIEEHRRRKDQAFEQDPESPIPEDERESFDGLGYYPVDPAYQVVCKLDPGDTGTVEIERTDDEVVEQSKAGHLEAPLPGGETVRLLAFEDEADHHGHDHRHLFVPFQDATSGEETFGAGRYLEAHELEDGRFLLDFNQAYHPFCAYDERYVCALPPAENQLDVPIEAGEKLPE